MSIGTLSSTNAHTTIAKDDTCKFEKKSFYLLFIIFSNGELIICPLLNFRDIAQPG